MKKVALSLATVLAAAAFAPEASAVPSFARQTGMACNACHFQKFPILNGFGRAFKASGYTLMGTQGKVEGDHMSIPETLNASILLKYRYVKDSGNGAAGANSNANDLGAGYKTGTTAGLEAGKTNLTGTADGQWQMGDEISLFFGGRIADSDLIKIGFINENNMVAGNGANGMLAALRIPVVVDAGAVKISAVPFATDAHGVQIGYEMSSGGVLRSNRWAEARREVSAVQYNADRTGSNNGVGGAASGHAFVVANDLFFVNYTIWSSSFGPGANGQSVPSTNYGQKYIRAAVTPNVAGWDLMAGFGKESGTSYGNLLGGQVESLQTFIDFQAHGELAGMETGIYFQNAKAPACTVVTATKSTACVHNTEARERSATTLGGEVSVIPHALTVGAAYRKADNGKALGGEVDNAITLTAVYDLFQNVALHVNYIKYSGNSHTAAGTQTSRFLGMLEAAF